MVIVETEKCISKCLVVFLISVIVLGENVLSPAQSAAVEAHHDEQNLVFIIQIGIWAHLENGLILGHKTEEFGVFSTEFIQLADLWFMDS